MVSKFIFPGIESQGLQSCICQAALECETASCFSQEAAGGRQRFSQCPLAPLLDGGPGQGPGSPWSKLGCQLSFRRSWIRVLGGVECLCAWLEALKMLPPRSPEVAKHEKIVEYNEHETEGLITSLMGLGHLRSGLRNPCARAQRGGSWPNFSWLVSPPYKIMPRWL